MYRILTTILLDSNSELPDFHICALCIMPQRSGETSEEGWVQGDQLQGNGYWCCCDWDKDVETWPDRERFYNFTIRIQRTKWQTWGKPHGQRKESEMTPGFLVWEMVMLLRQEAPTIWENTGWVQLRLCWAWGTWETGCGVFKSYWWGVWSSGGALGMASSHQSIGSR